MDGWREGGRDGILGTSSGFLCPVCEVLGLQNSFTFPQLRARKRRGEIKMKSSKSFYFLLFMHGNSIRIPSLLGKGKRRARVCERGPSIFCGGLVCGVC